jgi:hypothetical protein
MPIGSPFSATACGSVMTGKSDNVQGPFMTGSPVVEIPSGAVPGAAGDISRSKRSNKRDMSR